MSKVSTCSCGRPDGSHQDKPVDFDDRDTIKSSQGDDQAFNDNGVAVEGYQKSNLKGDNRIDLNYGVLVRNIASEFTSARVQVTDTLGVHSVASEFNLPTLAANASAINSDVSFEDPTFPPPGWIVRSKTGNVCQRDSAAKIIGLHGLLCQDVVGSPGGLVRAALRFALPVDRSPVPPMSWRLGAKLCAAQIPTEQGKVIYPLAFLAGNDLVAAMCLRRIHSGKLVAGVLIRAEDGMFREKDQCHRWSDHVCGQTPLGTGVAEDRYAGDHRRAPAERYGRSCPDQRRHNRALSPIAHTQESCIATTILRSRCTSTSYS